MADLKEALKSGDPASITAKSNALAQASMKLGEALYSAQQAGGGAEKPAGDSKAGSGENVVDADFEEVKDDKKK